VQLLKETCAGYFIIKGSHTRRRNRGGEKEQKTTAQGGGQVRERLREKTSSKVRRAGYYSAIATGAEERSNGKPTREPTERDPKRAKRRDKRGECRGREEDF